MHYLTCDEVADAAPRFALDILEPQARADVAAHLLRCPACRAEVTGMQESAARLLDVDSDDRSGMPWAEEPIGPQGAVGSGVGWGLPDWPDGPWSEGSSPDRDGTGPDHEEGGPIRPGRRRLRVALTLAAAALLMVGTTFGPEIEQASSHPATLVARAAIMAGGRQVGTVSVYSGPTPAIEIVVQGLPGARLTCERVGADGRVTPLGQFRLYGGRATWAAGYHPSAVALAEVLLLDGSGHVVAQAALA